MVLIKPGSFVRMNRVVKLTRPFWLSKFEVTQGEFNSLLGRNPSHFKIDPKRVLDNLPPEQVAVLASLQDDANRPVEKVSFYDAMGYCLTLTKSEREAGRLPLNYEYRLPSEAEWEYACRAGTTNQFSFGDSAAAANSYAWTASNSAGMPHTVGQKEPNPWGLYDMHGNVWEWVLDWFAEYPSVDVTDPTGPTQSKFKVFRGGGWYHEVEFARSANRFMMAPGSAINFVGFRVALSESR
jgi:formylglycine-generating enzyme required for sulfatase activity